MLISFEGIDGSGKSTQIKLLEERLQKDGLTVKVFREPGGTQLSEEIRSLLLTSDHPMDPVAELLLFSAARAQLITEKIKPLLRQDNIVILDRYYDSTVAYQGYGRRSMPLDDIHKLNNIATRGLAPDITFYLRLSLEEAEARTSQNTKDRMERSGREFYEQVIAGFDALAEQEKRFKAIDASGSAGQTHRQIIQKIKPLLN